MNQSAFYLFSMACHLVKCVGIVHDDDECACACVCVHVCVHMCIHVVMYMFVFALIIKCVYAGVTWCIHYMCGSQSLCVTLFNFIFMILAKHERMKIKMLKTQTFDFEFDMIICPILISIIVV